MSTSRAWDEPFLPWVESENDRRFKKILLIVIIVFAILALIVSFLPKPVPVKKDLKTVSPRLAKLVMERKKLPPPPIPKPVKRKAKPKAEARKKLKKPAKKKALTKKQNKAKKVAATSGLVAMTDDLNDLRESFDLSEFEDQPLSTSGKTKTTNFSNQSVIASNARKSSGGIKTSQLSKSTGGSSLKGRKTTKVSSNIATGSSKAKAKRNSSGQLVRSKSEIGQVFEKNKSALYNIYNRELRKDPSLQGKVVIELTISSSGKVTKARIVSSDLNNKKLERKLIARVKSFRFKPSKAGTSVVTYPIDFLPS